MFNTILILIAFLYIMKNHDNISELKEEIEELKKLNNN